MHIAQRTFQMLYGKVYLNQSVQEFSGALTECLAITFKSQHLMRIYTPENVILLRLVPYL